jgi:HD-GYP domain-containing protein (c-di-GMP phosphodiesterase class II)
LTAGTWSGNTEMSIELDLHGRRAAWLTTHLCMELDVARNESRDWTTAALTHDIGKLDLPAGLLNKPGALTGDERSLVERHCISGVKRLLARARPDGEETTTAAIAVAMSHHEWWNGAGYPYGLIGTAIPQCARVVAVADVLDALTSIRPYKPAWSLAAALEEITAKRALQFDPDCVDALHVVARTLPQNWRTLAQTWGLQFTAELGQGARALLNDDRC